MSSCQVSIVVPTYQEADNLQVLIPRVFSALGQSGIEAELIIVDDNSGDGTDKVVEAAAERHPVRLITRTTERGLSSAVVRGFEEARHDIFVCMDADLSHPPESLAPVIAPVAAGSAEFCLGSRYAQGGSTADDWGLLRWINSRVATLMALPLVRVRDPMAGFFCTRREVVDRARKAGLNPIGYKIGLEILVKGGCKNVTEIPIHFEDRLHGKSKLTLRQQLQYVQHVLRLYRFRWLGGLTLFALMTLSGTP